MKKFLWLLAVFFLLLSLAAFWFWRSFLQPPPEELLVFPENYSEATASPLVASTSVPAASSSGIVRLLVTGDVQLGRSLTTKMRALDDFNYPFRATAEFLRQADLTLINLESPFGQDCPSTDTGMVFCADYRSVKGLLEAGIDLASLANNHALNQDEAGLAYTQSLLTENFITPLGLREPVIREINGVKLGFLAYNGVSPQSELVAWAHPDVIASEIKRYRGQVDFLIVFFHWGREYTATPAAGGGAPEPPSRLAHLAIDAGADLVLGAHPHVVQNKEEYRGKLIVYSLGNFVFDQSWSQETQEGEVGEFFIAKSGLVKANFLPLKIINYQPVLTSP